MRNSNIEFKAGYYEWNVFLNGEHFYSFGTGIDEDVNDNTTYEQMESLVDDYIEAMQEEMRDNDKEALEERYIPELKEKMLQLWSYHYLDLAA